MRPCRVGQSFIGARRGVAVHLRALGVGPAGKLQQGFDGAGGLEAGGHRVAARTKFRKSIVGAARRVEREAQFEPFGRQRRGDALAPFDERHGAANRLGKADLPQVLGVGEPVEVGVDDRPFGAIVGLQDREGRAGGLELRVAGRVAQEGAGQRGLAGAQFAAEHQDIAGPSEAGEPPRERKGLLFAFQFDDLDRQIGVKLAVHLSSPPGPPFLRLGSGKRKSPPSPPLPRN